MQLASLGSGSKGNATLLRCEDTCVLIDCGFSLQQFEKRLQKLSLSPGEIDAILVTHEHADHGSGVLRLSAKYGIPLWMTVGTGCALRAVDYQIINGGQTLELDRLLIDVITVPHDAAEPVQFVFTQASTGRRVGILTDSGHISSHMLQAYDGLHGLLLEFNYDEEMLENGPYPPSLKRRIAGQHGHLSNRQSLQMLRRINTSNLDCLVAAHISEKNNSPQIVDKILQSEALGCESLLACQQNGFDWVQV